MRASIRWGLRSTQDIFPRRYREGAGGCDARFLCAVEQLKECTPDYHTACVKRIHDAYCLTLSEDEVGNRQALYKAHRYMGDGSNHAYPSKEQFSAWAIKSASGGGETAALVPAIDHRGLMGVAAEEDKVRPMNTSFQVAAR